ncbi:hypothetical protein PHYBOEH_001558 [Phytophthora boehmeriae]|uniref:RxLR effector protein n=1 Tax=Phytophthora boehmeriae TaxID=109152 RepID=A0A8T1WVZ1_9STRA|nr:hypothetical protein PHYBOEH_001558 [Phytophthora boehmeriae]
MRVSQVLLVTAVTFLASTTDVTTASKGKTPSAPTVTATQTSQVFEKKVPFKYGNITGVMVITIDPDSLKESSDPDAGTKDAANVYDFDQLDNSPSGDEERAIFGSSWLDKLVIQMMRGFRKWK